MASLKVFRNKNWTKRDYECSNVAACIAFSAPTPAYIECEPSFISNMQQLWIETVNGVDCRFYGWL